MYLVRHPASNQAFLFFYLLGPWRLAVCGQCSALLPTPTPTTFGHQKLPSHNAVLSPKSLNFQSEMVEKFVYHFTLDNLGVVAESLFLVLRQVNEFPDLVEGRGQLAACLQDIWVRGETSTCWFFRLLNSLFERPCCIEKKTIVLERPCCKRMVLPAQQCINHFFRHEQQDSLIVCRSPQTLWWPASFPV